MRDSHILLRWGWYKIPSRTSFPVIIVIAKNEAIEVLEAEIKGSEIKAIKQKSIYPPSNCCRSKNHFLQSLDKKAVIGVPEKYYCPEKRKAA